jgi:hypothetical protein
MVYELLFDFVWVLAAGLLGIAFGALLLRSEMISYTKLD